MVSFKPELRFPLNRNCGFHSPDRRCNQPRIIQEANLPLELDKVKDLLFCQGDTESSTAVKRVLAKIVKAEAIKEIIASLIREAIISPLREMDIEPVSTPLDLVFLSCPFLSFVTVLYLINIEFI